MKIKLLILTSSILILTFAMLKFKFLESERPITVSNFSYYKNDGSKNEDNDNKFIYITGKLYPLGNIKDHLIGYSTYGVFLDRAIYRYDGKDWINIIDKEVNINLYGRNISLKNERFVARNYKVKGFKIPTNRINDSLLESDYAKNLWVKSQYERKFKDEIKSLFKVNENGYLTNSIDLANPQIDDIQVRYVVSGLKDHVSILAKQGKGRELLGKNNKNSLAILEPYQLNNKEIFLIKRGEFELEDMIKEIEVENAR